MNETAREKLLKQFRELVTERLQRITKNVMALEAGPDAEQGRAALRDLHGLKGEARMMGFGDINTLVHEMEDLVRSTEPSGYKLDGGSIDALLVAADAYKRAGSTDPKALADAIRKTNITDNVSPGPGIQFNEKGQNDKLKNSAIQNRGGKLVTVAPKVAANAKVEWPMKPYNKR